ncbi:hypothetical protein Droror1_Dr00021334 [Drosera rotundifolia]
MSHKTSSQSIRCCLCALNSFGPINLWAQQLAHEHVYCGLAHVLLLLLYEDLATTDLAGNRPQPPGYSPGCSSEKLCAALILIVLRRDLKPLPCSPSTASFRFVAEYF